MTQDITRLQMLEDLKKAKYLLMLVTVFNSTLFATFAAIGAASGYYKMFVAGFVLCLINVGLFINTYQRWKVL